MLELIKVLLEKLDFIEIAKFVRARKDRLLAARLHLVLVQSYEILEIYQVLLAELQTALESRTKTTEGYRFHLNPAHISALLSRQASNLEVMEALTVDLLDQLRVLDNKFIETYRSIMPGKASILFQAQHLLAGGRLPLSETGPEAFPASADGTYRTLWFTQHDQKEDRRAIEQYLHGYRGYELPVVDVTVQDGEAFFNELSKYFAEQDPVTKLQELTELTESYKTTLMETFTTEELLADIGKVRRHYSHLR